MRIPSLTLNKALWIAGAIAGGISILAMITWFHGPTLSVINNPSTGSLSRLTGLSCAHPDQRPIAVMISSDAEARPLSGLAAADMVFEMPVTPNGITRMMAVYQCREPAEIGSIRSARQDFIPLAQGMNAILAHWGGEHAALEHLDNHVVDNVDALAYEGTIFYRKKGVAAPHNGFSTLDLIRKQAAKLSYAAIGSGVSYQHENSAGALNLGTVVDSISIPWPQNMGVEYQYDAKTNGYLRSRGGQPEKDAKTGAQISAGVVVVMETDATFLRDQYITVRTLGKGTATIYQDGRKTVAHWSKPGAQDMLTFVDDRGTPIALAPGTIWVEITAPLPAVR